MAGNLTDEQWLELFHRVNSAQQAGPSGTGQQAAATHGPAAARPRPAFAVGADALRRFAATPGGGALLAGMDQLEQQTMRPLAYWSNRMRGNPDVARGIYEGGRYEPGMVTGNEWADMGIGMIADPANLIPGMGVVPSPMAAGRVGDALGLADWNHVPGLDRARGYTPATVPAPTRVGTTTPTGRVSAAAIDAQRRISRRLAPRILRNPARLAELDDVIAKGVAAGGDTWYRTDEMKDLFRRALGNDQEADELFNVVALITAATSPNTNVGDNIQRGLTLTDMVYAGRGYREIKEFLAANPTHRSELFDRTLNAAMLNDAPVRQALESGQLNGQKISTFLTNYLENARHVTVDTHNVRALLYFGGMDFRTPQGRKQIAEFFDLPKGNMARYQEQSGSDFIKEVYGRISSSDPSGAAYSALEDLNRTLAARYELSPRDFQSALWVGAGDITNVTSTTSFDQMFMDIIRTRGEAIGIGPEEVIQRLTSGQINFADVFGSEELARLQARVAGEVSGAMAGEDEEQAPTPIPPEAADFARMFGGGGAGTGGGR